MGRQNSQLSLRRNEPSQAPAALAPKGLGVASLLMVAWLTPLQNVGHLARPSLAAASRPEAF
jgi:hypothetical protein